MGVLLLLTAVLSGAALVAYTLNSTPIRTDKTLSQHIMLSRQTIIAGAVLLSIIGVSLLIWAHMRQVPLPLQVIISCIAVAFIVMGVVPHGRGVQRNRVHNYVAWGSAPLMMASELLIAWFFPAAMLIAQVAVLYQLVILLLYHLAPLWHRYIVLVGQLVYFAAFFLILFVAEISYA